MTQTGNGIDCGVRAKIMRFGAVFPLLIFGLGIPVAILGCSPSREGEFAKIKSQADPLVVQSWATEILKQHPDSTFLHPYFPDRAVDSTSVILSNPPAFFKNFQMGRGGPIVYVSASGPSSNRFVWLAYSESFGFGGDGHAIEVGDPTFRQATNAGCVEWIPGVYFRYLHSH